MLRELWELTERSYPISFLRVEKGFKILFEQSLKDSEDGSKLAERYYVKDMIVIMVRL